MALKSLKLVLLFITGVALINPPDLSSCGPFIPEAQITFLHGPGENEKAFANGELGVLRPHFRRHFLVLAYRQLAGVPLNAAENTALFPAAAPGSDAASDAQSWLTARALVPGVKPIQSIDQFKTVSGSYDSYPNCLKNAFDTAANTLRDRIKKWGASSPSVVQWVQAQDQVFVNCAGGRAIPPPAPQGAAPLLLADRQYQIAAAEFYASQLTEAGRDFGKIANDPASPWHDTARYLVARVLIRQGTLANNPERLHEAQAKLEAMGKDQAAQQLLTFVRSRLNPSDRMAELGAVLTRPNIGPGIAQALDDYTYLWDKQQEKGIAARDDLTDWIETFQTLDSKHALDRWHKQRSSVPWLVASLVSTKRNDPAMPELIAAAHALQPASPAYPTVTYYAIDRQIERGDLDSARTWADDALATKQPASVRNLFLAERLKLARDWTEFLRYAVRQPAAKTLDLYDQPLDNNEHPPMFDMDVVDPMNRTVPVSRWLDASKSNLLPRALQADIAQAGWTRATLLDHLDLARSLARRLVELRPELATTLNGYLTEADPVAAKFAAVFAMLNTPALQPVVRQGFGRGTTKPAEIDPYRDNWWAFLTGPDVKPDDEAKYHEPLYDLYASSPFGPRQFLSADEQKRGEAEWSALRKTAFNGPNYLCAQTIAWAKAHPQDPRAPEALHLCVRATRYGPTDDNTGTNSKAAYDLLHAQYPKSKWAQMTKYWFK